MDATLEKRIQQQVFEDVGIVIDAKDPVFALAVICKEIIKEDKEGYQQLQNDVILEIRQIPGALSEAVEKVAAAVEDAETTSKVLCEVTEKALTALSDKAVEDAREALQTVTRDQVAAALSQINLSFDALVKNWDLRLGSRSGLCGPW